MSEKKVIAVVGTTGAQEDRARPRDPSRSRASILSRGRSPANSSWKKPRRSPSLAQQPWQATPTIRRA